MEATRAAGRESSLHGTLEEVRREADLLRQDLRDRDGRNAAAQATIASLHNAIREMRDTSLVRGEEGQSRVRGEEGEGESRSSVGGWRSSWAGSVTSWC